MNRHLVNLFGVMVLCIGLGLFEEALFRGVLLNSLLALLLVRDILPVIFAILGLKKQKGPDRGAFMPTKATIKAEEMAEPSGESLNT